MPEYLTKEGLDNLKKELENLEKTGRKEAAEKLKQAVSFGDISENAAYDAAREAHSLLESRISELKGILASAKLIDLSAGRQGKNRVKEVRIGSTVLICCNDKKDEYCIVGPGEADVFKGKISYESPLGKLLLGRKKKEKVIMKIPDGNMEYQIMEIK
ncbi:MAG: transcription elongation factor GreA [bacterium]|nr:transcription elongation factor GreA [bacterium]